jgi:DNA-3-methyladenine glycosylase II
LLTPKETHIEEFNAIPPYNFELTVRKPAGWWWSTPYEKNEKETVWTATRFDQSLVGIKLQSIGTTTKPKVKCTFFSNTKRDRTEKEEMSQMMQRALRINEDLSPFYWLAKQDQILQPTIEDLYGMHTVAWPELFPALILAVTLQMAPMKRSNQMMDLLISSFGEKIRFDGQTISYWPSTKKIAHTPVEELELKAKLGYRAKNLVAIAEALEAGFPKMDELYAMEPVEAEEKLLELCGIGDYSAELIMPGMGFPLDVWSAKIFSVLFYGKVPDNPREVIPELKKAAENRWGRWKGYAFVYVLNDLPRLSKNVGVDLTRF